MNATAADIATDAPAAPRVSAHANCDHPKTKAARAACRRARNSDWIDVTRGHELAAKGCTVRVHVRGDEFQAEDMLEGVLLGWGSKTIILRVQDERVTLKTADAVRVEGSRKDAQNDA